MTTSLAVTVTGTTTASRERVFDTIVPIELASVFNGYGPLPAVTRTTDQTGDWDAVGQTRTVHLSDGSKVSEQINSYERPASFGYRVGPFGGLFGHIARHADGMFLFYELDGTTQVSWTYTFEAQPFRGPVLKAIAILWRRYAQQTLDAMIKQV